MTSVYSENTLVEQLAIEIFVDLGWQPQSCYDELCGPTNPLGRETRHDVVPLARLRAGQPRSNSIMLAPPIRKSRIVAS